MMMWLTHRRKAWVVSVTEKVLRKHQVWFKEGEQPWIAIQVSKLFRWHQNRGVLLLRD